MNTIIENLLQTLNYENKINLLQHFDKLISQFISTTGLNKNIYIFMDNNVIQDAKFVNQNQNYADKDKIRIIRFISVYLFFDFIKKYTKLNIKLVISPVIFYELSGRKKIANEKAYDEQVHNILQILSIFNVKINFYKFNSYSELNNILEKVIEDEIKIIAEINNITLNDWTIQLKDGNKELLPFTKSFDLIRKKLDLQYFQIFYVNFILASKIEKFILENKNNDTSIRKKYLSNINNFPLSSLIKVKKNSLFGLGDIELFQECDLSYQYAINSKDVLCAITFDDTLYKILLKRQTYVATHKPIVIGTDSKIEISKKLSDFFINQEKLYDIELKERKFLGQVGEYYEKVITKIIV